VGGPLIAPLCSTPRWLARAASSQRSCSSRRAAISGLGSRTFGLNQCRMPFAFLIRHGGFRHDAAGSVMLGLRHGAYCVGCCWALMTLLFEGGVMKLPWILLLALLVLLEKVTSIEHRVNRCTRAAPRVASRQSRSKDVRKFLTSPPAPTDRHGETEGSCRRVGWI
jgi:hypothetical protein